MTTTDRPSFVYVTYIATTPEKLWTALTDGKFTREYWGGRAVESDWKVGSPVRFRKMNNENDHVHGKVLEVKPPWQLAMSWAFELAPGAPKTPESRVTFSIERAGPENVKLTVVHDQLDVPEQLAEGLRDGWPAILSSLKTLLETGAALDITKRWAASGQ